ncbi:MAG: ABC transporter ATP-binding protein [Gammaproteobacteria bacterium]|nr:ABC transporter ATP-binding protein [Gammaproteobacteria bacterium]
MLEIEGLCKRFDEHLVVNDLSFTVQPGEVLGFLGPNGAGKSTTMKMIAGFLRPDAGTARIGGADIVNDTLQAQSKLGYLPEGAPAYGDMRVDRFLEFMADMRSLRGELRRQRLASVVHDVHLESVLAQRIDTLSKGFRRRVGLAQAILHDPDVLILDEPTDGLDPNQKHEVRKLISNMSAEKIIVISTHILEEVEAVCSRAMIIANGRLLIDGTPLELAKRSRLHGAVTLQMKDSGEAVAALQDLPGVVTVENDEALGEITAIGNGSQNLLASINDLVRERSWPVDGVYQKHGRLDEVFRSITREALT